MEAIPRRTRQDTCSGGLALVFSSHRDLYLFLMFTPLQSEGDTFSRQGGFQRGSNNWWRQQHYTYEFVGSNGVQSMEAVQLAMKTLQVILFAPA
jgi:hypothetical protein